MKRQRVIAAAAVVGVAVSATAAHAAPDTTQRWIDRDGHHIYVEEQPGTGPAIVLMHGFPDNHHLYDRVVPELAGRRVVTFDFLGWGDSDKPADWEYTFENQAGDLDAVIEGLGLEQVVLVVHDASGPAGINWALDHPDRVAGLVILNTFYGLVGDLQPYPPDMIGLFAEPEYVRLAEHFAGSPAQFRWLFDFQIGGFFSDPQLREEFVPLMYEQFAAEPSTLDPFRQLTADLFPAVFAATGRAAELAEFTPPVRVAFGDGDPYLHTAYGEALAGLFPAGSYTTLTGVGHFPQLDAPGRVAEIVTAAAE